TFEKEYKGGEAKKLAAVEDLGKTHHPKTASRLGKVVETSESSSVRQAAVKALGAFTDAKKPAGAVLSNILPASAKDPGFFGHTCIAIGELKEPVSANTLAKFFEDKDENMAKIAIEASGKAGCSVSIDPLIQTLGRGERAIRAAQNAAGGVVTNPSGTNQFLAPPEVRARDRAKALNPAINKALGEITKESLATSDAWQAWWARNKDSFDRK
ncbi:MAG TPA: HEAT repeat domain-containing protein, partial [Planctomycetota bacterium]|nr:HEAT repeat domain-containing protein [Planctomycetota bacterium]